MPHFFGCLVGQGGTSPLYLCVAVEADNVFFHLTYEGAVDVSKVKKHVLHEVLALLRRNLTVSDPTPWQLKGVPL